MHAKRYQTWYQREYKDTKKVRFSRIVFYKDADNKLGLLPREGLHVSLTFEPFYKFREIVEGAEAFLERLCGNRTGVKITYQR